jgi:hypothetical protein
MKILVAGAVTSLTPTFLECVDPGDIAEVAPKYRHREGQVKSQLRMKQLRVR